MLALNASNACTGFSLPFAAATCSAVCASVKRQYLPYAYLLTPSALCLLAGIQRCLCVGGASVFVLLSKASKPSVQRVHRVLRIRQHTSAYVSIHQEGRLNRRCSVRICTPVLLSKASKPSTLQRCLPASMHASAYLRASQDMLLNRHPWRLQRPPPPESTSVCVLLYQ